MVTIDMKLPEMCEDCPCSYWIRTGPNSGRLMCQVMEANGKTEQESLVEEWARERPRSCPIQEVKKKKE